MWSLSRQGLFGGAENRPLAGSDCAFLETISKRRMSLRGAQRRSNLNLPRGIEIASLRSQGHTAAGFEMVF